MTARRRIRSARILTAFAATTGVCASLLTGCGMLPGDARADEGTVTVMTWAPQDTGATDMPGMPAMAEAYARWVNATGGISGRTLRVLTCNDHNESVSAARCANRAREEGAVAVVGSYSQHGRTFMPALESAGIPYIGGYGVTDEEFTSPFSYPVNGGQSTLLAGNGHQLAEHCEHVSLVRPDTVAGDRLPDLLNAGLAEGGRNPATDVRAPEDASAYADQARRALTGVGVDAGSADADADGACVTAVLGGRTDTFFDSFRRLDGGTEVRIASVLGSVRQSLVDATGGPDSRWEGAYATGWYPVSSDPRWGAMREVVREHAFGDNRIDPNDPGVQTTWIAYTVLRAALENVEGTVTARSVQRALESMPPVDTGGLTPKLSWRYEDLLAVRDHPRLVNSMVTFQQVREGRLAQVRDGFVDVRSTLEATPAGG
ncbi:ABC transporter substrate-binding protein [Streptomyces sp. TRM43335]|uniref:ABC transporter substrate-binding protein n=1 Tax=Streptomyces taklimakanensis TaxID=2569853 RepID=A0A6G2BBD6_9ACTN|nr:ABC transporter substrate-binding protein [Streptomyces taklimakanensis]MTE19534.1 ABC transporter substrate-binding protein [Streptomyces taklimakanensis]